MVTDVAVRQEAARLLLHHLRTSTADSEPLDAAEVAAVVAAERLRLSGVDRDVLERLAAEPDAPGHPEGEAAVELVEAGIERRAQRRGPDSSAINPGSGHYPVATTAAHLRAAIRAGHRSLRDMPYYGLRYGERGVRFTNSDSAWLVRLSTTSTEYAVGQVDWLARVLAVRGMPSWLLEDHLFVLAEELASFDKHAAEQLRGIAEHLAGRRRAHVSDGLLDSAEAWLLEALPDGVEPAVPRAGALVAAETADRASGLLDSWPCTDWLRDPARFEDPWCAAVTIVRDRLATWSFTNTSALPGGDGPAC